jgi:hypothetical protein
MAKGTHVGIAVGCAAVGALAAAALAAPHRRQPPPSQGSGSPAPAAPTPGTTYLPAPTTETTHKEGDYGGVEPDRTQSTDPGAKPKPKRRPPNGTLSWIGFEPKDGGSEVFFQSPAAFDLAQHVEGNQLVVELGSLNQLGANTWRPIDTHFFDNPLARIEAHRVGASRGTKTAAAHGAGVEIRITFKNAADAKEGTYRSSQETDGYYYAYLTFGAGTGTGAGSATISDPEK